MNKGQEHYAVTWSGCDPVSIVTGLAESLGLQIWERDALEEKARQRTQYAEKEAFHR
jgi:hypothetical protein